jgi:hypothetical protein
MYVQLYVHYVKDKGHPMLCLYRHEWEVETKASTQLEPSARRKWVVRNTLQPPYPRTNTVSLYRELGGPRGRS